MRNAVLMFAVAMVALFLFFSSSAESGGSWLFECPHGKGLLRVGTFDERAATEWKSIFGTGDEPGAGHYVSVRIKEKNKNTWRPLRTERSFFNAGIVEFNCVPSGRYDIRAEYYRREPIVGGWLMAVYAGEALVADDTVSDINILSDAKRMRVTMQDHIREHGVLFGFFALTFFLFGIAVSLLIRHLRKRTH